MISCNAMPVAPPRCHVLARFGSHARHFGCGDNTPLVCFPEALALQCPLTIGWNLAEYNTVYARARVP
jgi:hypothetical protein